MKRRTLLWLAAAVALLAIVAWALRPQPVAVELAAASTGPYEQAVSDDGVTRVRDRYVVSAPLAGRVERIALEVGDPVKQGETLASLTPTAPAFLDARTVRELQERVGAAQAQLARAKAETLKVQAQRDQAQADSRRQEQLSRDGFVSANALEQARLQQRTMERAVDAARFAEDAAGHDLAQARAALSRYRTGGEAGGARWAIASPVTGAVLRIVQKSEGVVALGAPLLEIADPRSLEAVVDVLSQEAVAIRPGMQARVDLGRGLPPLAAVVRRIEPAAFTKVSALGIEEQRVNVILDFAASLDRVQTLGDGFRVEAHIVTLRVEDAVKAPVGALFRDGEGWAVFVASEGRAAKRPVKAPMRNGAEALVSEGLRAGERVVVYPPDGLRDGARIRAVD